MHNMQESEFIKPSLEGDYGMFYFINGPRLPPKLVHFSQKM